MGDRSEGRMGTGKRKPAPVCRPGSLAMIGNNNSQDAEAKRQTNQSRGIVNMFKSVGKRSARKLENLIEMEIMPGQKGRVPHVNAGAEYEGRVESGCPCFPGP